jgi:hypothetical protein
MTTLRITLKPGGTQDILRQKLEKIGHTFSSLTEASANTFDVTFDTVSPTDGKTIFLKLQAYMGGRLWDVRLMDSDKTIPALLAGRWLRERDIQFKSFDPIAHDDSFSLMCWDFRVVTREEIIFLRVNYNGSIQRLKPDRDRR